MGPEHRRRHQQLMPKQELQKAKKFQAQKCKPVASHPPESNQRRSLFDLIQLIHGSALAATNPGYRIANFAGFTIVAAQQAALVDIENTYASCYFDRLINLSALSSRALYISADDFYGRLKYFH